MKRQIDYAPPWGGVRQSDEERTRLRSRRLIPLALLAVLLPAPAVLGQGKELGPTDPGIEGMEEKLDGALGDGQESEDWVEIYADASEDPPGKSCYVKKSGEPGMLGETAIARDGGGDWTGGTAICGSHCGEPFPGILDSREAAQQILLHEYPYPEDDVGGPGVGVNGAGDRQRQLSEITVGCES